MTSTYTYMPCTNVQPMQINVCKRLAPWPGLESAGAVQFDSFVPHIFLHYTQRAVNARTYVCTYVHMHKQYTRVCLKRHTFVAGSKLVCLACLGSMKETPEAQTTRKWQSWGQCTQNKKWRIMLYTQIIWWLMSIINSNTWSSIKHSGKPFHQFQSDDVTSTKAIPWMNEYSRSSFNPNEYSCFRVTHVIKALKPRSSRKFQWQLAYICVCIHCPPVPVL